MMIIWYVCTVISVVLLVLMILDFIRCKEKRTDRDFAILMLAGFFSYFPHYISQYEIYNAAICDIVNLLQIVTLNSNTYETYQPEINNVFLFNTCIIVRGAVHMFSPVLGTVAAYNFAVKQYEKLKFKLITQRKEHIYIFSETNEKSVKIAADIMEKEKNASIIFYHTQKLDDSLISKFSSAGFAAVKHPLLISGQDGRSNLPVIQKGKATELFYFLINDKKDENMNDGLQLALKFPDNEHIHINIFSDTPSEDELLLDSIKTTTDIRVIHKERLLAYQLLHKVPLYQNIRNQQISVLIVDWGNLGKEVFFAALACGQMNDVHLKINILAEDGEAVKHYLNLYYPEILKSGYDLHIFSADFDSDAFETVLRKHCMDTTYAVVCREEESKNIQTGIQLRKFFLSADGKFQNMPVIAVKLHSTLKSNIIKDENPKTDSAYQLIPFGSDESVYTYEEMVHSELESLAKRVHLMYACMFQDGNPQELLKDYYALQANRKSNVAMALSIQYKLYQMGFSCEKIQKGNPDFTKLKEKINALKDCGKLESYGEAEHKRWMAFKRSEGWKTMSPEESKLLEGSAFQTKKGQSVLLMMHSDICDYQELEEKCKKIGKSSSKSYDTVLIEALPDILGSRWQSATGGAVYQIKQIESKERSADA